jgi:hypothetical protein
MSSSDGIFTDDQSFKNYIPENWEKYDTVKKQIAALQALENYMAKQQGRDARTVKDAELKEGDYGEYSYGTPDVLKVDLKQLNNDFKNKSSFYALAAVIHEGRHAQQHDAVNNKLNNNPFDKKTLKEMGQNFIYGFGSREANYISQKLEADAFNYTNKTLEEIGNQFEQLGYKEWDQFNNFFREQEGKMERLQSIAVDFYNIKTKDQGDYEQVLKQAEKLTAKDVEKGYEQLQKKAQSKVDKIERMERKNVKKKSIDKIINKFREKHYFTPQELLRQMRDLERGEGLVAKEKGDGITLSYSVKSPDENKTPESSQSPQSSQSPPDSVEREKNKQAHLNEIKWLKKELAFLEKFHKTTNHEPSRQSLENTIEALKGLQEKLTKSIYEKHGVTPDKLTEYRELAASHGYEAIRQFEYTGQYDAGFLADAANRAINVMSKSSQTPTQTEQAAIVANLIELKNYEKAITLQLVNSKKSLTPDAIEALKEAQAKAKQDYKSKFAEAKKRPDKKQIMQLWIENKKQEVKTAQAAKGKEHTFSQTK